MACRDEETFGPVVGAVPRRLRRRGGAPGQRHGVRPQRLGLDARRAPRAGDRRPDPRRDGQHQRGVRRGVGSIAAPMGGMKSSGLGRRHGREGLLKYTETQNDRLPAPPRHRAARRDVRRGVRAGHDRGPARPQGGAVTQGPRTATRMPGAPARGRPTPGTRTSTSTSWSSGRASVARSSALRAREKGHRVLVLEAGRGSRTRTSRRPRGTCARYLWAPRLGCYGIQRIHRLQDVVVLAGAGVGGGSLNYANTLYVPPRAFFEDPQWSRHHRLGGRARAALRDRAADARRRHQPVRGTRRGGHAAHRRGPRCGRHLPQDPGRRLLRASRASGSTTRTSAAPGRAAPAAPSAATAWSAAGSGPRTPW